MGGWGGGGGGGGGEVDDTILTRPARLDQLMTGMTQHSDRNFVILALMKSSNSTAIACDRANCLYIHTFVCVCSILFDRHVVYRMDKYMHSA